MKKYIAIVAAALISTAAMAGSAKTQDSASAPVDTSASAPVGTPSK